MAPVSKHATIIAGLALCSGAAVAISPASRQGVYMMPPGARGGMGRIGRSSCGWARHSAAMVSPRYPRPGAVAAQYAGDVAGETFFGGLHNFLGLYNLALTVRILLSWFPQVARQPVFEPLFTVTNPFFNIFRGLIPPIGGLDLSPLPAFFLLSFVTNVTDSLGAEPSNAHSASKVKTFKFGPARFRMAIPELPKLGKAGARFNHRRQ